MRRQPGLDWFWASLNGEDGGLPSQTRAVQQLWNWRASWTAANWMLPFVAIQGEQVVGVVEIYAQNFPVLRTAELGIWIDPTLQKRGHGKEMAAGALHFLFEIIRADEARWGAPSNNPASLALARALGFTDNGVTRVAIADKRIDEELFRLPRERWQEQPKPPFTVNNTEACLPFFGPGIAFDRTDGAPPP